eukprot:3091083-Prymnesium_polylepis.1
MKIDANLTVDRVVDHVESTLLAPLGLAPTCTSVGLSGTDNPSSSVIGRGSSSPRTAPQNSIYFNLNSLDNRVMTWGLALDAFGRRMDVVKLVVGPVDKGGYDMTHLAKFAPEAR